MDDDTWLSVKVAGADVTGPLLFLALMGGAYAAWSRNGGAGGRAKQGRWVYDRALGGRKVGLAAVGAVRRGGAACVVLAAAERKPGRRRCSRHMLTCALADAAAAAARGGHQIWVPFRSDGDASSELPPHLSDADFDELTNVAATKAAAARREAAPYQPPAW